MSQNVAVPSGESIGEFTHWLMSFDSTTGFEVALAEPLAQWLEARNWSVLRQPISGRPNSVNILATRQGCDNPALIFNSHLDTVPPYIAPKLEGNILKGRGSCDAKGQIAAMILAAEKLARNSNVANNVGLLFTAGEETDHFGMIEANKLGLKPKYLIVGEPTELQFVQRGKGEIIIELKYEGKAAHSSNPEKGISALEPIIDVIQDLRATCWPKTEKLGKTTVNFGVLNAGAGASIVPAFAEAQISFRVVTDIETLLQQIKSVVRDRVQMNILTADGPVELNTFEGYPSTIVGFTTDIYYFDAHRTTDCYLFGAGSIADAHADWEFVNLDDLNRATEGYYNLALKLLA